MWPSVLGLISIVYCVLSIRAFLHQRRTFQALVGRHSASSLNLSRYFRLMALAATDISLSVPFSIFFLHADLKRGLKPWVSWSYVHWGFSQTPRVPIAAIKEMGDWPALEINRWSSPVCAVIFFCFFGLAGESLAAYKRFFVRVVAKPLQPFITRCAAYMPWRSQGDRAFDGGVTLPSTPGAASSPGWQTKSQSRFTEPPTPVSALKSSRPFFVAPKERRESDIESGLDYYFADEKTLTSEENGSGFVPPSLGLPPRALSATSLRRENSRDEEEKDLPEPPSPAVFDIRRFSSSASFVNGDMDFALAPPRARSGDDDDRGSSALPSASDSAAFPLDLSSFPIPASLPSSYQSSSSLLQGVPSSFQSSYSSFALPPSFPFASSSLLTATSLNGQFRNSLPARYSFAPATGMTSSAFPLVQTAAGMGMSSPPAPTAAAAGSGLRFSEVYRHSYAGPASPRHDHDDRHDDEHRDLYPVGQEPENCYDIFPPTPMAM